MKINYTETLVFFTLGNRKQPPTWREPVQEITGKWKIDQTLKLLWRTEEGIQHVLGMNCAHQGSQD